MSGGHDAPKPPEPALREDQAKGPRDMKDIPRVSSDIAYWSQEFSVSGRPRFANF